MRRKLIISAISAFAVAAIIGALAVTHRFPSKAVSAQPTPVATVPVVAGTVINHDVPIYLQGVGTVIAYNTVIVRSQIQGQITLNQWGLSAPPVFEKFTTEKTVQN